MNLFSNYAKWEVEEEYKDSRPTQFKDEWPAFTRGKILFTETLETPKHLNQTTMDKLNNLTRPIHFSSI